MKIIVVGCGKIGKTIAESLSNERHDVLVIDNNPEVITEVTDTLDVMGLCGNGTSYDKLEEAGVKDAELFIAVTDSDELNMLSCFAAKKLGAKHTVARIRSSEYNTRSLGFMREALELSMVINPELLTAEALYNVLKMPSATKVESFENGAFKMVEIIVKQGSALDGISMIDLRKKVKEHFLISAVQRGNNVYIPNGLFRLRAGDKIGLTATGEDIHGLIKALGVTHKQMHDVMLLGASRISYYLAKKLLSEHTSVKIIDRDAARCTEFAELLDNALIINGDGMNQETLMEEGIDTTDAFIALSGSDETNILIGAYALTRGVSKVIGKVNRRELEAMAERLGLETLISPKYIIADTLVRYARALQNSLGSNVETLYSLLNGGAEALEFNVAAEFPAIGVPLKNVKLKPGILIAGITRDKRAFIPGGEDYIDKGDKVIVIAAGQKLFDLKDVLNPKDALPRS